MYTRDGDPQEEFQVYRRLSTGNKYHPGYPHIRTALDIFTIPHTGGDHACLIQKPMWDSFKGIMYRIPDGCFTETILKGALKQLFLALDYLHTECQLVHTGTGNSFPFLILYIQRIEKY
jgi:serine/threonine-protein kinase SRPK3